MPSLGSIGDKLDLLVKQGSTFGPYEITLVDEKDEPINLNGCTFLGHIKKSHEDPTPITSIDVTVIDEVGGKFTIGLSSTKTALLLAGPEIKSKESSYIWDFDLTDAAGKITTLYYGDCKVFREVTKL